MSLIEKAAERFERKPEKSLLERAEARGLFGGAAEAPGRTAAGLEPEQLHVTPFPPVATGPVTPGYGAAPVVGSAAPLTPARSIAVDFNALAKRGFLSPARRRSRLAEEMRIIRHRLMAVGESPPDGTVPRRIMVTSARPGEGKSFLAVNLALSLAIDEAVPVILIDADARQPALTKLLKLNGKGFTDVLAETVPLDAAAVAIQGMPLTVLPAGGASERSSEARIRQFASDLAARLPDHVVIYDTPPLLSVTEPVVIAPHVDRVVMVVEANKTSESAVTAALDLLPSIDCVSMVLNKAPEHLGEETFGSYYGPDTQDAPKEPVLS